MSETRRQAVLWRQLDALGLEHCRWSTEGDAPRVDGAVIVMDNGVPWRLEYDVRCDSAWRTRAVSVRAVAGASDRTLALDADANARWTVDGVARDDLFGCLDVDLGFSPATNTLPIRRLGVRVGEQASIDVAWVEFPTLTIRRASQRYTRLTQSIYRFEYLSIDFVADIEVDANGLVVVYPGLWERTADSS